MIDYWVQMDEGLIHSRLVDRLRALGLDTDQVIGKLYRLWTATLALQKDGVIGDRSDAWIEEAVLWRGEPGAFAAVIRAVHLDEDGRVRDWLEKYGKLEAERAKMRNRKRAQRTGKAASGDEDGHGRSGETVPETVPPVSHAIRGDDGVTLLPSSLSPLNAKAEQQNSRDASKGMELGARLTMEARLEKWAEYPSVQGMVRAARNPNAVLATLDMMLEGELGETKRTPEVMARAAADMNASSDPRGFNAQAFRIFCDTAEKGMKRSQGREINRREERVIEQERDDKQGFEREQREAEELLRAFADESPEEYDRLLRRAEAEVPKKLTMGRELMVRAKLLTFIREARDAA